jgi:aspartyl protease family protein
MIFSALALIVAGFVPRYFADMQAAASRPSQTQTIATTAMAIGRTVTIRRGDNGHFQVEAVVDGRRMDFLVDTGATGVALRESDAARLGLHPTERDYTMRSATANGIIRVAPVALDRVEVGDITVHNVAAAIFPDEALSQNLLGMSFLSRLRWQQENGRLVLEQQ